ncbi:phasin family protein [Aureimonas ureilytica]|uniref:phasin family protein n=1 Tax=Aureimonas ureilytica TaxID=401562 RepID=UPI003CECA40E
MNMYADAGQAGKEAMDTFIKSVSTVTKGFQQIAAETGDFTKRSYETSAKMLEELAQTRTPDKAIEIQTAYFKSSYDAWMAQATKMNELYANIARETFKPFETSVNKATSYAQDAMQQAA